MYPIILFSLLIIASICNHFYIKVCVVCRAGCWGRIQSFAHGRTGGRIVIIIRDGGWLGLAALHPFPHRLATDQLPLAKSKSNGFSAIFCPPIRWSTHAHNFSSLPNAWKLEVGGCPLFFISLNAASELMAGLVWIWISLRDCSLCTLYTRQDHEH